MKDETILLMSGVFGIVILESIALLQGINGSYLLMAFTSIGGIIGYAVKGKIERKKQEQK